MAIYSVYLPPNYSRETPEEGFRVVSDTKAPLALVFPPFWLTFHGLWLELLGYCVATLAIILLAIWSPSLPVAYLSAIPGFYLLLEGNDLICRKLERKGWYFAGVVDADDAESAELKFLLQNGYDSPAGQRPIAVHPRGDVKPSLAPPKAMGLFPE